MAAPQSDLTVMAEFVANNAPVTMVDGIWDTALASFAANGNQIVLPAKFRDDLTPTDVDELKWRLRYTSLHSQLTFANPS